MLDYPLDKLAGEVSTACWTYNKIEDIDSGECNLNQILNFMKKSSSLEIWFKQCRYIW